MSQMKFFGWIGLTFLYAVFIVIGMPAPLGDYLFYRSDIFSLSVFVLAAALVIFPLLGAFAFTLSHLPEKARSKTGRWAAFIAAIGIVDIFLALFTLYIIGVLNWTWWPNHLLKYPIVALAGCFLPAALFIYIQDDKEGLIERVKHVGCFALVMAPLLIGYSILTSSNQPGAGSAGTNNDRHLTYIVLDGWPSQFLHAYNPEAPASAFDEVLGDGRVYLGAYSSAVWTGAHFGVLYNGDAEDAAGDTRRLRSTKSLGAGLQEHNIGVRFINFHRNGIPDSSAAHRSDHKGLRSYFLTERYYWIPQGLGLDYHIAMSGPSIAKNFKWFLPRALYKATNPSTAEDRDNMLIEVLLPQLRRMRKAHSKSFTLFHASWKRLGQKTKLDLAILPDAQKVGRDKAPTIPASKIRENNYQYDPKLEPLIQQRRERISFWGYRQGSLLREFITALRADPILSDTVVVLTADHGTIYAKGRLWYIYHPNREVVRVPLIVFDSGMKGKEQQLFATPALTKGINNFFAKPDTSPRFEPVAKTDTPAFSLTRPADVHKEWYLVATFPDKTYWLNLHPEGPGQTAEMKSDGYQQTETARFDGAPPELASKMKHILKSFGINQEDIHRAFR